jgi:hypothetical protein
MYQVRTSELCSVLLLYLDEVRYSRAKHVQFPSITSPSMKHQDVCIYLQMGVVIMKQTCKMTVKTY